MSAEKRQQLIDAGQLNEDGTRTAACPTCGRPFGPGEGLAAPEPVVVSTAVHDETVDEGEAQ